MVEVTFKTITQITFKLNLEPNQTIADVKKMIADEKGDDFAVELQKLIYNGKVLEDGQTVENVGIDPAKFVVVMLSRKKQAEVIPAASTPEHAPTPAPTPAPFSASVPSTALTAAAASTVELTADQTDKLNNVLGMGYTREQALRALKLADWDANRAVNLLLSGSDDFDAPAAADIGMEEEGDESGHPNLEDLANLPQFEELRNIIRTDPSSLPEIMRDIATVNPALMNTISQNQQAFLQMMTAGGSGQSGQAGVSPAAGTGAGAGVPGRAPDVIRLTPEESAAIQRIKDMGLNVPDALIIEAYLACDKNEELAVSYIMDAMDQFQE